MCLEALAKGASSRSHTEEDKPKKTYENLNTSFIMGCEIIIFRNLIKGYES